MKKFFIGLTVVAVSFLTSPQALAVPARPGLINMVQSDGSCLKVKLIGDELFHYYLTEDDYLLVENSGDFYYAATDANGRMIQSSIKAVPAADRTPETTAFLESINKAHLRELIQEEAARCVKQYTERQGITPPTSKMLKKKA